MALENGTFLKVNYTEYKDKWIKGGGDRGVVGSGGYVIWPLRVELCLETGDLI